MGNNALNVNGNTVNGGTADIAITTHGSDWYWVCTLPAKTFGTLKLTVR